jgi:methionine synthase I (cobalamin-dependent)
MIAQLELTLTKKQPEIHTWQVEAFTRLLFNLGCWVTAAQLAETLAMPANEQSRRTIRAMAEAASPDVISGQMGYRHIETATAEEVRHCVAWFDSQAKKMAGRANAIRRRAHQLVG